MRILLVLAAFFAPLALADTFDDLKSLVAAADSAESYEEFRNHYSGHSMLEKLDGIAKTRSLRSLCLALQKLDYEDQILFVDAIEEHRSWSHISCFRSLLRSIARTTLQIQRRLELKVAEGDTPDSIDKDGRRVRSQLGPSEDRNLPSDEALNLPWDDSLPEGTFALTFDDGPHPRRTREILDILNEQNIQATFFVLGERIDRNPQMLSKMLEADHTLGSHTYSHPDLSRRTYASAVKEIEDGEAAIEEAVGSSEPMFRFPYGAKTSRLMDYLKERNIHHFFWDVDTLDWKKRNPEELLDYAIRQTEKNGRGIVLFHDIHSQTVAMMPAFLRKLKQNNYKIVVYRTEAAVH